MIFFKYDSGLSFIGKNENFNSSLKIKIQKILINIPDYESKIDANPLEME